MVGHKNEFLASVESMMQKHDRLSDAIQQLKGNVNQLSQKFAVMKTNIAADIIRELRKVPRDAKIRGHEKYGKYYGQGCQNHNVDHKSDAIVGRNTNSISSWKLEFQLQDESKQNRASSFIVQTTTNGSKFVPKFNVARCITTTSRGGRNSNAFASEIETSIKLEKCKENGHMKRKCQWKAPRL